MANDRRAPALEALLSWTYQHGFTGSRAGVQAYLDMTHAGAAIVDLGTYPDSLDFFDSPAEAAEIVAHSRFQHRTF